MALWHEFEARETDEARFAAAIDGLQPLINHALTGSPEYGTVPVGLVREKKAYIESFAPTLWFFHQPSTGLH